METEQFEAAIARLPRLILALSLIGTLGLGSICGIAQAGGFLLGALAAYFNFRLIERAVNRIAAAPQPARQRGVGLLIQFAGLVLGGFVIIKYSGFSMAAAFFGFLVCPAAVVLEIVYELVTYEHS
jgi:hypothetical protein